MRARPVAHYLIHFGLPEGPDPKSEISQDGPVIESQAIQPGDSIEAIVLTAREEGFARGVAEAGREWEEKFAHERQAFELRLAGERANWAREESEMLCEKIQAAFAAVESNIAGCVARILKPLVIDAMRAKFIDVLADSIGVLLRGQKSPMLSISGPEDLLTSLRERLSHLPASIEYALSEAVDVQIISGETLIETQLSAFSGWIGAERR